MRNDARAQDAMQDVFVSLLRHEDRLDDSALSAMFMAHLLARNVEIHPKTETALVRVRCKACSHEFLVSPTKTSSHEVGNSGEHLTALVADIQRDFRNWVVEVLRRNRFHLFITEDGEAALAVAKRAIHF